MPEIKLLYFIGLSIGIISCTEKSDETPQETPVRSVKHFLDKEQLESAVNLIDSLDSTLSRDQITDLLDDTLNLEIGVPNQIEFILRGIRTDSGWTLYPPLSGKARN